MNIKKKVLVWLTSAFLICTTIFGSLLNSHITKANNSPTNKTSQELKKDNKEAGNNETNNKKSSQENKSRTKRETQSSDKINLTLKPLDKTTYQTQENITTYVEISGNSLSQPLEEGSVLEIEMPTTIHKQNMSRTTQAYLDNFSVATSNIPFIKETKLVEENGKTIYRIIFKKFDLTTKISIPYVFSFTDGLVPKDYKLKPIVRMKDNTGKMLVEKQDKEYNPIYPEMQANKNIAGNTEDDQVLYGGLSNKTDKSRISKDNAEPIPFNFSYKVKPGSPVGSERIIEKAIIKDTLPTYVNSEGQTVRAKFDPTLNPGWEDNGDGTVSYTKEYKVTDYTDNIKVNNIILYLSFPDAKYKDNNGKPEFINKVEVTGIPFNPSTDEKYVASDEIKFKIIADDFSGTGILAKRSEHRTVNYDKNALTSERLDYTIKVSNKLSKPMKEITLIEDASKYDQRLYITKIDSFYQRDSGSGAVVLNDKIEVRAYKDDNTYDVFKVNEELNKEAQDELNATAEKVREGKISADDAQGITPKYKKITLYFKDYELPVGYNIDGQIYMAFKDPYHVEYSEKEDIKNVVSLDSKIGETTKVTAEDEYNKKFIPLNERITIGKQTQDQKTGIEGETVNFAIFADFSSFSNYRYMKNPTFIDLLPKGVSKTDEVELIEQPGSKGLVESWSVIENYNNSGRTAVKIVMKSGFAKDLVGDDQTKNYSFLLRYFKINKEIIPTRAESDTLNNNNDLYFYFDNGQPFPSDVKADQLVEDTNDINMTGDTKDKVLKTQSKVIGNAPDSLTSTKYIRSVEPLVDGGDLYYGRSLEKEIETEYSGKTDKSGHFQYNLQVKNYYNSNLNKVAIYDVLPHENDNGRTNVSKTSAFSNILTGPIKLKVDSTDVTDKFDVYYRTDKYPSMDPKNEENSSSWTQNPTNYAEVTAFKIVSKSSFTLQPYKILHAIVDMKAPVYNENKPLTNKEAINTFHVKYNDDAYFAETNSVINRVVERTSVAGEKTWDDNNDQAGKRPDKIKVILNKTVDGKTSKVAEKEVTKDNWSYEFTNLPKFEGGKEITYSIDEEAVAGYTKAIDGYSLKNSYTPEVVNVQGTKTWDDANNQDGKRPTKITVILKKTVDGQTSEVKRQEVTPNSEGEWKYEFTNLPLYEDGKPIEYSIDEEKVAGYDKVTTRTTNGPDYNLTNKHEPETVNISGEKTWDDNNNQDGKRPQSITVKLMKQVEGGQPEVKETKVVTKGQDDKWKYEFNNLPRYENGKLITYSIDEVDVPGYTKETTATRTTNGPDYNLTNKHEPETVNISGEKTWDDNNNQDGKRPQSITVKLMKQVEGGQPEVKETKVVTKGQDDKWKYEFNNLPRYENGKLITYSIDEEKVDGYDKVTTRTTNGPDYNLTNKHEPETVNISGEKTWDDNNNQDGKRPQSITVKLMKQVEGGQPEVKETKVVTKGQDDKWKYEFNNLPRYENGKLITYSIDEEAVTGYKKEVTGYNLKNSYTPGKTKVQVTKAWEDKDNQDGKRPASVTVKLLADGVEVPGKTLTLTATNNWTGSFTDLDEYKAGNKIVYTVKEEEVGNGYDSKVIGSPEDGFKVINTRQTEKVNVEGTKTWNDADNQDGKRPTEIKINLLKNGTVVETKTVTEKDGWKWKFENLDKYANGEVINYTITEEAVENGYTSEITKTGENTFTVKNTREPEKTFVEGEKTWDDANNQDGKRPTSIKVKLYKMVGNNNPKYVAEKVVTEGADKAWKWKFENLDKYENKQEIQYIVAEKAVDGYTTTINGTNITNTHTPEKTAIEGTKTWDDANNQDGKRPTKIKVILNKTVNGKTTKVAEKEVTEKDNWNYEFTNLPKYEGGKEITYSIDEEAVPGYEKSIDGYNLKNSYTPEVVNVQGTKTWDDANNQDGKRPDKIKVILNKTVDGVTTKVAEKEVTKDNWNYEFTNLPKYEGGKEITYSIDEEAVPGYEKSIDGYNLKNSYTPEVVNVQGTKTWDDANNQDGKRPDKIKVILNKTVDGKTSKVAEKEVTAKDNWNYAFNDLPKYENGKEIKYSIDEVDVPGYKKSIKGYNLENKYIPKKPGLPKTGSTPSEVGGLGVLGLLAGYVLIRRKNKAN